jgi:hypothetical protein
MTPYLSSPETLRVGYSTRTKLALGVAAAVAWLLTYSALASDAALLFAFVPGTLGLITSALLIGTLRSSYSMHRSALHHTTWTGRRTFPRASFLGAEMVDDSGGKTGLLLRFQTGVLLLSNARGCSDVPAVQRFLEQNWQVSANTPRQDHVGPVNENIVMEYEAVHLVWLGIATIALAGLSSIGPMFWASAVLAFFTGRTFHRIYSCQRISTSHEGLTISRPLQPERKIRWDKITSARYWYSLTHGGLILSDGTNTVRIYRWIQNYPRFNRLVQDNVASASFAAVPSLPWSVSLNRRRQSNWLVLLITAGVSLWLVMQGAWPAGLILMTVPSATFAFTVFASGRKIVIDQEKIRLVEKKSFVETTHDYLRTDLQDMRLGRQLSVGGLWMKFGSERLEIGNLDSSAAPEEIFAALRRAWQGDGAAKPNEFRAA